MKERAGNLICSFPLPHGRVSELQAGLPRGCQEPKPLGRHGQGAGVLGILHSLLWDL